jgi:hypothetical protein
MELIFGFMCFGVVGLVAIAINVFWVWMLVECLMKESSEGNDKVIWALVIVFLSVLGAAIYFFVRRPERIRTLGQ